MNAAEPPAAPTGIEAARTAEPYFFTATPLKLAVMSVVTGGIYELYWFYKNWVLVKQRTGQDMMPFWRALFAPLWAYSFFKQVRNSAGVNNVPESMPIGLLAIAYFAIHATVRLPDPYWLITFSSFAVLMPANNVALQINRRLNPDFRNNGRFTGWNWAGVVLGGSIFALNLLAPFLLEEPAADIASPAIYEQAHVRFLYPRNWKIAKDTRRDRFRYLLVESPGSAGFVILVYPKQRASSLSAFVERFSKASGHESPIKLSRSSISRIENSDFSPSKRGVRETLSAKHAGISVSIVREYYRVDAGEEVGFLISVAPTEDVRKAKPGFDLILRSFVIE